MSEPKRYVLTLAFDVDQVTRALQYSIENEEGSPYRAEGRCAGTLQLDEGTELILNVQGYSRKKDAANFVITDCVLAFIPTLPVGTVELSMFDQHRATTHISEWGLPHKAKEEDKNVIATIPALHPLTVIAKNGQWEMSGYLSVLIEKQNKGETQTQSRLFYFDPEMTSGTGGDIID